MFRRFDEPESALVDAVPALVTGVLLFCLYSTVSLMRLAFMRDHEAFVQEVISESQETLADFLVHPARWLANRVKWTIFDRFPGLFWSF